MRRVTGAMALATLTLLGGCARPTPPQQAAAEPVRGRTVAQRSPVVNCTTTYIVLATVSRCGPGDGGFGASAE